MTDLASYRDQLDRHRREYDHAVRQAKELRTAAARAAQHLTDCLAAQKVVQSVAAGLQESAHTHIARIVSRCLGTVWEDPYQFRVVFEQKRGKTEARLVFERGGKEHDPKWEVGGGVVDVSAFALRLAKVLLQRPAVRRVLFLDEPFKHLSRDHGPRVRSLLLTLAEDLGFQFVVVTHSPALVAGKVVEL